ncbi:MAG: 2Fe-2S iron-sulfur cluster-binding protein, partial [Anaerolineales bacterium]
MNNGINNQKHFLVELQPIGRRIQIPEDKSVLEAAQLAGVDITSICGGIGICGSCKVRLMHGELSSPTLDEQETFTEDELQNGYRLACQAFPRSDVIIDIPPESLTTPQRLQLEGQQADIPVEPAIQIIPLELPLPSITDLRADFTRLKDAIGTTIPNIEIEYPLFTSASALLRDADWKIKAVFNQNHLISILPIYPPSVIA